MKIFKVNRDELHATHNSMHFIFSHSGIDLEETIIGHYVNPYGEDEEVYYNSFYGELIRAEVSPSF